MDERTIGFDTRTKKTSDLQFTAVTTESGILLQADAWIDGQQFGARVTFDDSMSVSDMRWQMDRIRREFEKTKREIEAPSATANPS